MARKMQESSESPESITGESVAVVRAARKPREPLAPGEVEKLLGTGLHQQVQALIASQSRGYKTCQQYLLRLDLSVPLRDKWRLKTEKHTAAIENTIDDIAALFGDRHRTPPGINAIRKMLEGVPVETLQQLAAAKGIAWSDDTQEVVEALAAA